MTPNLILKLVYLFSLIKFKLLGLYLSSNYNNVYYFDINANSKIEEVKFNLYINVCAIKYKENNIKENNIKENKINAVTYLNLKN